MQNLQDTWKTWPSGSRVREGSRGGLLIWHCGKHINNLNQISHIATINVSFSFDFNFSCACYVQPEDNKLGEGGVARRRQSKHMLNSLHRHKERTKIRAWHDTL